MRPTTNIGQRRRVHTVPLAGDNTRATALKEIRNSTLPGRAVEMNLCPRGNGCYNVCKKIPMRKE